MRALTRFCRPAGCAHLCAYASPLIPPPSFAFTLHHTPRPLAESETKEQRQNHKLTTKRAAEKKLPYTYLRIYGSIKIERNGGFSNHSRAHFLSFLGVLHGRWHQNGHRSRLKLHLIGLCIAGWKGNSAPAVERFSVKWGSRERRVLFNYERQRISHPAAQQCAHFHGSQGAPFNFIIVFLSGLREPLLCAH